MKVVILAAGKGSRLGDPQTPKALALLENGKSILSMQLEALSGQEVWVVVGFQKEKIMQAFPHLHYVHNPDYASENTSKSLLKALQHIDEELIWINGDVLFHPSVLQGLIAFDRSAMVVNVGSVAEEEVKYQTDGQGRITAVSKEVIEAKGEALGINLCKKKDFPALRKGLEACAAQDYFEKGVEWAIGHGTTFWSYPIDSGLCTEIDFPEDLERANGMLRSWKHEGGAATQSP